MRPITVTWDGGVRFTADIRGHKLTVDQPTKAGGEDSAPMPVELLPASLGTCVALYVQQFLATRGLDPTGMTVVVTAAGAPRPNRLARFALEVKIPGGVPEKYRDAVQRTAEGCTVHHTLTHTPQIAVTIMEGSAAATG
ncbi:MAG: OsmC family protein [Gemmatimonadota bacterium]|nr:OsmC family protein [Gemmatimonadota bacterium]MDH3571911.1 OsmC family protein [Gemmatimonadota bacterium]